MSVALEVVGWLLLHSLIAVVAEVAGCFFAVLGIALALTSYPISVAYFNEYPGKFDERLEEYVARRVSRLIRAEFIPQYRTRDSGANKKIRELNERVSLALGVEKLRLEHTIHAANAPICGLIVVGPEHTNKTGALWDAMAHELRGWTFVRWPHHMDYPANLAQHLGRRIVLWIDDLHDFARAGEAAAVVQFIQQLRQQRQRFLVLASCQDGEQLQEAKRFFSPLIADLQPVHATEKLPPTEHIRTLEKKYAALTESQKSVLRTMEWLESMRIFTFTETVLAVLHRFFENGESNPDSDMNWDEAIKKLTTRPARFVRVDERVEVQAALLDERYDFGRWFRNNFFRNYFRKRKRARRPQRVVEPLNVQYLNLEKLEQDGSRVEHAREITTILEQQPGAIIEVLERYPVAVETLILLGDAYLNHLGETIENAAELALKCYQGALQRLDKDNSSEQFPGAWAVANIGNGTAKLRLERFADADVDFSQVTGRPAPGDDARPIPPILTAHAWHGRGDVIAAQIPRSMATNKLNEAAGYYEQAANSLPQNDALSVETRLDRANVLHEIADSAAIAYEQSLSHGAALPPITAIDEAQKAYKKAQASYSYSTAPAVWAEIHRRQGELCLMETIWLLPSDLRLPPYYAGTTAVEPNPHADKVKALETAKIARDHFIAARNVFAPSYLPHSWLLTQIGLIRALLVIARVIAKEAKSQEEKKQAREIYLLCLVTANTVDQQNSLLIRSPLDWIDVQLLRAKAEIGRAPLDDSGPQDYFKAASELLNTTAGKLNTFEQMVDPAKPDRMANQLKLLNALRQEIK